MPRYGNAPSVILAHSRLDQLRVPNDWSNLSSRLCWCSCSLSGGATLIHDLISHQAIASTSHLDLDDARVSSISACHRLSRATVGQFETLCWPTIASAIRACQSFSARDRRMIICIMGRASPSFCPHLLHPHLSFSSPHACLTCPSPQLRLFPFNVALGSHASTFIRIQLVHLPFPAYRCMGNPVFLTRPSFLGPVTCCTLHAPSPASALSLHLHGETS